PRGAHFAVISHGENGNGAYDSLGVKSGPACTALSDAERENCDGDATIIRAAVQSLAGNKTDDLVAFNVTSSNEMWERVPCGDDLCLRNRNVRNVIVGSASTAVEKLTVGGMLRADQLQLGAAAKGICDANGQNCFKSNYIGGTDLASCGSGYGATLLGPSGGSAATGSQYQMPRFVDQNNTLMDNKNYTVGSGVPQLNCAAAPIKTFNFNCPGDEIVYGLVTDLGNGKVAEPQCYDPCATKDGTVETSTRNCPEGYSGTMTCQSIYSCATGTFTSYECNNSACTPNPVPGVCGAAHNVNTLTAPVENLCNTGVASAVSGSGPWTWTCAGQHGGATASCQANRPVSGECGSANDTIVAGPPPSGSAACSVGSVSGMTGAEPYKWNCVGTSGGTTAECKSRPRTTVNGQCGSAHGGSYASTPSSDLCNMGTSSAVASTATEYNWTCNGGGTPTGSNDSCTANKITTVNGVCGSANG
ncbi:MAG: hypothetical protein C0509_07595, partial [Acinetobacter sp.]|nr:hypothetical protein [Acinetobacter sp.]